MTASASTAKIGSSRCTHTWPGHRMRTHDRGQVITLIGAHRCILAADHPPGCLCHCGATNEKETNMTELDLDGIEARAADIANYVRSEPVVFLVGATHARVSLLTCDVRELVAEVRRLRAALADRQTMAAVYGYELGEQESLERLQWLQEIIQQMALQLRAAIALHQPDPDGGIGYQPGGGYGDIDPACSTCGTSGEYAVPWPCQTYESLARAQQLLNDQMPDYDQRVRREAAADALAHAADLIGRHHGNQHGLRISEHVDQWAAEVRAGTRTIPPAGDSSTDPPTTNNQEG